MATTLDRRSDSGTHRTTARRATATCLGRWRLVRHAASGAFCDVYQAQPGGSRDNCPAGYAVKVLREEWQHRPEALDLLRREALVGRTVSHRHLLPVLDAELQRAPYFVVTPWLEGRTLDIAAQQEPRLPVAIVLWIGRQVAEALEALDAGGWTHGDIKPGNLLVGSSCHLTLLDLGFARHRSEERSAADRAVVGTPNYLAPESFTSRLASDRRSDIYSLGAVLFHLLAGRPPFVGDLCEEVIAAQRTQPAPKLKTLCPTLLKEVGDLVQQMLAKDPLRRPQTAEELIGRLARLEISALAERF